VIGRETVILNDIREHFSGISNDNSAIATEFAVNGSSAGYLPQAKCVLSDANRIMNVIVGIALAMRFLHSRCFSHRNLKPDNFCWIGIEEFRSQTLDKSFH
jgi:serine/threonine protein kinase